MPDTEGFPRWGRHTIRGAMTAIYAILAAIAAGAVAKSPPDVVALVGLRASLVMCAITGIAAVLCAASHAFHLWLVERAALPFALIGVAALAVVLWVGSSYGISDPLVAGLTTIAALALLIRLVQLEVFARSQPHRRRKRARGA